MVANWVGRRIATGLCPGGGLVFRCGVVVEEGGRDGWSDEVGLTIGDGDGFDVGDRVGDCVGVGDSGNDAVGLCPYTMLCGSPSCEGSSDRRDPAGTRYMPCPLSPWHGRP